MSLMNRLGMVPPNATVEKSLKDRLAEAKEKREERTMTISPFFYRMVEGCGVAHDRVDGILRDRGMNMVSRFMQVYNGRRDIIESKPVDFESLLEMYVVMKDEVPEPDKASLMFGMVLEHPELGEISPVAVYQKLRPLYDGLNARQSYELASKPSAPYEGNHRDQAGS